MAVLANRAAVATATTGTGTITLGAALSAAFCTFAEAGVVDGAVVSYLVTEGDDFELGRGTYTAAGTTLSRDTVLLSKIGGTAGTAKMTLAGAAEVRIAMAAEDLTDGAGSGLDADLLDAQHGAFYRDAANLNAGILPAARFDDTAHGSRGGGALHVVVTGSVDGFMAAADKSKLDGIEAGATADQSGAEIQTLISGLGFSWTGLHDFTTAPTVGGTNALMHKGRGLANQTITLGDDNSIAVTRPANCGVHFMLAITAAEGGTRGALCWVGASSNNAGIMVQDGTNYEILNGTVLTGTTGTDGKVTIGMTSGTLYLENRAGASRTFSLSFLANR